MLWCFVFIMQFIILFYVRHFEVTYIRNILTLSAWSDVAFFPIISLLLWSACTSQSIRQHFEKYCVCILCIYIYSFRWIGFLYYRGRPTGTDSLATSPLQSPTEEKPEDKDNLKNSTRVGPTGVNIPVTITAPPGETTVIPSKYSSSLAWIIWAHCDKKKKSIE